MHEQLSRLSEDLLQRAGLKGVPAPAVLAAAGGLTVVLAWGVWHWWPANGEVTPAPTSGAEVATAAAASNATASASMEATPEVICTVHVVGAVRHPGVYSLPKGARVVDAVKAAGGVLPDAVTVAVNLARPVSDGEQIVVPDEDTASTAPTAPQPLPAPAAAGAVSGALVNVNIADEAALDTLPGVGPSTAQRIVADREANGPFASVEDLGRVSGIGPKRLEQLRDLVCVQ